MHLTGKIFAFFTLCLSIGAMILTAKTITLQNEWNQKVEQAREKYEQTVAKLPDAEKQAKQLRDELTLTRLNWGRHWDGVSVLRGRQPGQLTISIGRNDRLSRPGENGEQAPNIYAFQPTADGGMQYVGQFRVTQMDVNQAAIQLVRTPRPGEVESWNVGQNVQWRFRDSLPASKQGQVDDLLLQMTRLEQRLQDQTQQLAIQKESVASARKVLEERMKELNGNDELPEDAIEEYRIGLVAAVKKAEDERNARLAEVQRLRKQLDSLYKQFESLVNQNKQLEEQLSSSSTSQESEPVDSRTAGN